MKKNNLRVRAAIVTAATLVLLGAGCMGSETNTVTTNTKPTNATNTSKANTNTTAATEITFDVSATDSEVLADDNGQWAKTATASSEYGTESWTAKQATGKPNVTAFGDNGSAWAPYAKSGGKETLELTFAKAMNVVGVRVRESYGNGSITKIELKDVDGGYHAIWSGTDTTDGLSYLQAPVEKTSYKVDGVKLTFDTSNQTVEWSEVDAVQLVGE